MEIEELKQGELELCKTLRLSALKDAPGAFAETYLDAINESNDYWQNILEALTPPNQSRMFIARDSGQNLGSVFALLDTQSNSAGRIGGMWVDSSYRKTGIGTALFFAVKTWAHDLALNGISLWVDDSKQGPKDFYLKLGFKESGLKDFTRAKINKNLIELRLAI